MELYLTVITMGILCGLYSWYRGKREREIGMMEGILYYRKGWVIFEEKLSEDGENLDVTLYIDVNKIKDGEL